LQNFKYLKGKRVAELTSTSVFLHILEAEKELLVTVDVSLPEQAIAQLESVIFAAYRADGYSEKAVAWNEFRKSVVDKAVRKGLVPLGSKWVREWMKNEVEDFTAWTCGQALEEVSSSHARLSLTCCHPQLADLSLLAPRSALGC
jgi:transcription elongation factor SPT6